MARISRIDPSVDVFDDHALLRAIRKYRKKGLLPDNLQTRQAIKMIQFVLEKESEDGASQKSNSYDDDPEFVSRLEIVDSK